MRHARRSTPVLLAALLATAGFASAQERQGQGEPEPVQPEAVEPEAVHEFQAPELPGLSEGLNEGLDAAQQEMIRLFHEVERTLAAIDLELYDASAGRIPMPEGKESGIERLLRSNGSKSDQAVTGIERILEIAESMGQSCSSCMKPGQQPKPGQEGKSPLDQERQRGPSQGEKTPDAPKPEPEGEQPGEQGQKPDQSKPKPDGQDPLEGAKNPPPGENVPSSPRVDANGNPIEPGADADRWGALPERVQQVFQNQITDDLPLQYRDWIDSYYRRLNRSR